MSTLVRVSYNASAVQESLFDSNPRASPPLDDASPAGACSPALLDVPDLAASLSEVAATLQGSRMVRSSARLAGCAFSLARVWYGSVTHTVGSRWLWSCRSRYARGIDDQRWWALVRYVAWLPGDITWPTGRQAACSDPAACFLRWTTPHVCTASMRDLPPRAQVGRAVGSQNCGVPEATRLLAASRPAATACCCAGRSRTSGWEMTVLVRRCNCRLPFCQHLVIVNADIGCSCRHICNRSRQPSTNFTAYADTLSDCQSPAICRTPSYYSVLEI